jgi:minor extracellular serine protease Vpr
MFPQKTRRAMLCAFLVLSTALAFAGSSKTGAPPRTDWTEVPATATQSEYAIVTFQDPPTASYSGGIPGFARTKPNRGKKLNPADPAVAAYARRLSDIHQNFRNYMAGNAPGAQVVREFVHAANALAVKLNGNRLETLANGPDVKNVSFSTLYHPTMNVSTTLIRAADVWPSLGGRSNAGAGIKAGIIDSGIDQSHPFFACKGTITHKVYASGVAGNPNNLLVSTHGTHVAGTVAGCVTTLTEGPVTGTISGVAPAAELHDYNVFPGFGGGFVAFGGSAFSQDIAAALEDTIVDGMDVVNMSLGGKVQGPHDLLADAVNATVDAGLVVAVAAGNSGPGDSTVESPGSAANALTAGASTNPHFLGIPVTVGGNTIGAAVGDFAHFESPVTAPYTVTTPANGCSAISTSLTGKIALIDRGTCTFTTKVRHAENAGAIGVIVVNNVAGDPSAMGQDGTTPVPTISAVMVGKTEGTPLKPSGTAAVDGTTVTEFITKNADIIAGFSSRGPAPFTALIKPDVTAPGVNVYSSVFNESNFTEKTFAMFQGTSMATPHLTGTAALLLQRHPDWSPADVKSAIVNNASRTVTDSATGKLDAGLLARGGGRVDVLAADTTPLTIAPVSASFGYWSGSVSVVSTLDLTVNNVSGSAQSCRVSKTGPSILSVPSSVSVGPGTSTTLTLNLNAGQKTASGDYKGDVVLNCGTRTLLVPWFVRINRQAKP